MKCVAIFNLETCSLFVSVLQVANVPLVGKERTVMKT